MKKLKSVKEEKDAIEKVSTHQNEQELSIRELLEVQGGLNGEVSEATQTIYWRGGKTVF